MAKKVDTVPTIEEDFLDMNETPDIASDGFDYDVPLPRRTFGNKTGRHAANEGLIDYILQIPVGASRLIPLEGRPVKVVKTAANTALRRTAEITFSHTEDGVRKRHIHTTRSYAVRPDASVPDAARVWHLK